MVADGLQRMEMQSEESKPMFEIALKNAVAAAVMGTFLYKMLYPLINILCRFIRDGQRMSRIILCAA